MCGFLPYDEKFLLLMEKELKCTLPTELKALLLSGCPGVDYNDAMLMGCRGCGIHVCEETGFFIPDFLYAKPEKLTEESDNYSYHKSDNNDSNSNLTKFLEISRGACGCNISYIMGLEGEYRGKMYYDDCKVLYLRNDSFLKWLEEWIDSTLDELLKLKDIVPLKKLETTLNIY
jgi:hypothetical protein